MMTDTKNTVNGDWCLQNGALINLNYTIHPTVHQSISSTRFSCTQGHWWQPLPAVIGGGDRLTLSQQISEPHRDKQSFTVTHTHTNMQLRVSNSPQMYVPELDVGGAGEPRRHEENKPHTEGSRPEMEPTNLLLWGGSANNCVIQKSHFMWKKNHQAHPNVSESAYSLWIQGEKSCSELYWTVGTKDSVLWAKRPWVQVLAKWRLPSSTTGRQKSILYCCGKWVFVLLFASSSSIYIGSFRGGINDFSFLCRLW